MKKRIIVISVVAFSVVIIIISSLTYFGNNSKTMEINDFYLEYSISQMPFPDSPSSYTIQIDMEGTLTKKYSNFVKERDGDRFEEIATNNLSYDVLLELIDVILENDFFKLPHNVSKQGNFTITDQKSQFLTIAYNGKENSCGGYYTDNIKFSKICNYVELLAKEPSINKSIFIRRK